MKRNLKKELNYYVYDTETIDYESLIKLLRELIERIETLERKLEHTNPDFTGCYD